MSQDNEKCRTQFPKASSNVFFFIKEKLQIVRFEELEPWNVREFCLKKNIKRLIDFQNNWFISIS